MGPCCWEKKGYFFSAFHSRMITFFKKRTDWTLKKQRDEKRLKTNQKSILFFFFKSAFPS